MSKQGEPPTRVLPLPLLGKGIHPLLRFGKEWENFALCGGRLRALPLDPASFWKRSAVPTPQIVHCNTKT